MAVDRDKVLQAAQKLVEKKRYDKAVVEYQKLVADDPKDVRTLLKIGDLFLKMEQHVDAITTYERVGQFYSTQGFALKAIAVYKQIREIIHKHVPHMEDRFGHIVPKLAEIYQQLGLTSDALAAYDEVATRFQRAGRDRDAIDVFKKVVDLDPQNALPYLRLGEAFIRVKDVDNALQRFGAAAEILLKLGRKDDALKVVERLLQHRADAAFARTAAEIYLDRGQPSDAMAALTKLQISFKENPKDLDTLALLARAFDKLGQPSKAIEVQKESARIAKETNKLDQFNTLVTALVARAPDDDAVKALSAQRAALIAVESDPRSDPRSSSTSIDVEVDEVMDEASSQTEEPFKLQTSYKIPQPVGQAKPAPAADPAARLRQFVAEAEKLRRSKEYEAAVAVLVAAVEELPASRELREKLCDLLIEAGDQTEAIRQMLEFARWLASTSDIEGAARLLDEVLLLEPGQSDAIAMLRELGYAVGPESYATEGVYGSSPSSPPSAAPSEHPGADAYDPNAPLPSYDLEEISAVDALSLRPASISRPPSHGFEPSEIDDPFAEAPLPSFDIEEAQPFIQMPPRPSFAPPRPSSPPPHDEHGRPSAAPPSPSGAQLDEEALEEVEFFASHGMFDEARALLDEQLLRMPNHPLLLERKREVEAQAAGGSSTEASGARVVPRGLGMGEDRSFDIADALDQLDQLDQGPQPGPQPGDQVSVESVFEQFKAGVAAQISDSDAATHYDLGVAYKEMGLISDAIAEFELAGRDPTRECVCHSMIGMIFLQHNNLEQAIDAFVRGLQAAVKTRDQELALSYEIGDAYEQLHVTDQSLYYFQRVTRIDPQYADMRGTVTERIRRLEPAAPKPVVRAAVGADVMNDEFDDALDDLLGSDKLP